MNVKSLFEVNNFTTEPSSPVRGDFGTFLVKSTEECEAEFSQKHVVRQKKRKEEKKKRRKVTMYCIGVHNLRIK